MKKYFLICYLLMNTLVFAQNIDNARQLLSYKRFKSAENYLHTFLKNDPTNAEAWYLLSDAYLCQHKITVLADTLNKSPQDVKDQPFYQVARGSLFLYQNDTDKAKTYFNDALEKTKSKKPEILLSIARAEINAKAGNAQEALALLEKAIKKDKNNPQAYIMMGDAYRKLLNGSEAYRAYTMALQKKVQSAEAHYRLGLIFKTQKNAALYLKYFNDAIAADPGFAPAFYQLYLHYYFHDVYKAMQYLKNYIATSDPAIENDYNYTDLLYLTGKYNAAIKNAKELLNTNIGKAPARLYKLIAYSYEQDKDTANALLYMKKYFNIAPDSMYVVKDYATMADLYAASHEIDSAIVFYKAAAAIEKDTTSLMNYYKKLSGFFKQENNYSQQAAFLGKYYTLNSNPTNVDLFNWGIAHYQAEEYALSDSVFSLYAEKYPEQDFGYYWQARNNVVLDSAMEKGLAVPYYIKVTEVAGRDSINQTNRKHLIEAYGYLAAYKTNREKDYEAAINYFEKILALDPDNSTAKKYIEILKKDLDKKDNNTGS